MTNETKPPDLAPRIARVLELLGDTLANEPWPSTSWRWPFLQDECRQLLAAMNGPRAPLGIDANAPARRPVSGGAAEDARAQAIRECVDWVRARREKTEFLTRRASISEKALDAERLAEDLVIEQGLAALSGAGAPAEREQEAEALMTSDAERVWERQLCGERVRSGPASTEEIACMRSALQRAREWFPVLYAELRRGNDDSTHLREMERTVYAGLGLPRPEWPLDDSGEISQALAKHTTTGSNSEGRAGAPTARESDLSGMASGDPAEPANRQAVLKPAPVVASAPGREGDETDAFERGWLACREDAARICDGLSLTLRGSRLDVESGGKISEAAWRCGELVRALGFDESPVEDDPPVEASAPVPSPAPSERHSESLELALRDRDELWCRCLTLCLPARHLEAACATFNRARPDFKPSRPIIDEASAELLKEAAQLIEDLDMALDDDPGGLLAARAKALLARLRSPEAKP